MKHALKLILVFFCLFVYPTCALAAYKLAMLPRYSTEEIYKRIAPLAEYLHKTTGLAIDPVVISTFSQFQQQLLRGSVDIGYENPYIYALVSQSHEVIALAEKGKSGARFRGVIITRADNPNDSIEDLRGTTISIVGYTSAGGFLSQKLSMQKKGIDVKRDCQLIEAAENKQENVILAVYTGEADYGFIRESALHQADKFVPASSIKVLKRTAWLPNWALSVNRTMAAEDKEKIRAALLAIPKDSPVAQQLKITSFVTTTDANYDSIRKAAGLSRTENPAATTLGQQLP